MRFREIQLYSIIGNPIAHSLSPCLHGIAFRHFNINAVYLPFLVKPNRLGASITHLKKMGVRGFNVTIPFKEKILRHIDKLSDEASVIGAVNTVHNVKGHWIGHNTDGMGFIAAVGHLKKIRLNRLEALIFGAGGMGRTVGYELLKVGVQNLVIVSRSPRPKLLRHLVNLFPKASISMTTHFDDLKSKMNRFGIVVNATPLGLSSKNEFHYSLKGLNSQCVIVDTVYRRNGRFKTKLLRWAHSHHHLCVDGLDILYHQAKAASKIWTGKVWPLNVYRSFLATIRC